MSDLTLYSANPSRGFMNKWLLEELKVAYDLKLLKRMRLLGQVIQQLRQKFCS
jgi:hypothetical protein